ncbi:hypothetical protein EVAR_88332_1 [Eumeta japonica]|uniref:Uncharacterized protein n=1 Tax=Eumeta variegata TaxID=151549 RepID=A0A4C1Y8U0_EUMVA|nr:hypothetical protein EVAR_88332_1 [Eumeta japonica]
MDSHCTEPPKPSPFSTKRTHRYLREFREFKGGSFCKAQGEGGVDVQMNRRRQTARAQHLHEHERLDPDALIRARLSDTPRIIEVLRGISASLPSSRRLKGLGIDISLTVAAPPVAARLRPAAYRY